MYEFMDRLINVALPRIRDFRGVSPDSFYQGFNFTLGLTEQGIFPDAPDSLEWLDATRVKIPDATACAVMVGSVGQPRHETDRRAAWVLWDPASRVVDFRKTSHDRL